jgi:hypothetical protein
MFSSPWVNNINKSDILPPMTVKKTVKESKQWQMAVLDSFEHIGIRQFEENTKFWDYYRMVEGKMSYQELREVVPHLEDLQDLLDGVGVPSFLKHYDILGSIINQLVGKYIEFQDNFHVVDTGEIAQNEFLRYKDEIIQKALVELIDNEVNMHLAKNGFNPESNQQFESQEQQQQYIAQLEEAKNKFTPTDTKNSAGYKFKTMGIQWGEATMDKDREELKISKHEKEEFKDMLLTGRCFREYKIGYDNYYPVTWSPKNTFFSKELSSEFVQDGEYVGRVHFYTPSEIIKTYGHLIATDVQKQLLGGNETWRSFLGEGIYTGSVEQALNKNFNVPTRVPFHGYHDYNFYLGLQDHLNIPMGEMTIFNKDGSERVVDRYLPRQHNRNVGAYNYYANILRDDFVHRDDLCQVTEVYFRAYDLWGYLTYEDDKGTVVTEEVTEDILTDFIKEKNIKTTLKESMFEIQDNFEVNTLKWIYRPVCYEAVKIQSGNLQQSIYLYCKPCDHQIKGVSEFDIKLPVAGKIGKAIAPKIMPFQAAYNVSMNQLYNLMEKEIGIFFLLDTALIPSEIEGWGDAEEAMVAMRNMAKDIGIMPIATSGDAQKNNNNFNQFTTHNMSFAPQMQQRISMAEFFKMKAFEVIGINPGRNLQPEKYVTAEGVKISNEESYAQVAELYEDMGEYVQRAWELHLSVAQYCQSNKKDITIAYTKSDSSLQFLKLQDPNFPLRKLGLLPSKDGRKRKELETFKQYLLNTNTLGSDTLEIAMSERKKKQEAEETAYKRQQELIAQQGEQKAAERKEIFEMDMALEREKSNSRIRAAELQAKGRAADSESDSQSFDEITKTADLALKDRTITGKLELDTREMNRKERADEENRRLKLAELTQKAKELEAKIKMSDNAKYIATINKN